MRPSETMPFVTEESRCGEIFVSNKADKWTFFCSYCQKGTSDIGVFICHIRLDHLSSLLDGETQKENTTPEEGGNVQETHTQPLLNESTFARDGVETDINFIKEETLSQNSFELESVPTKVSKTKDISLLPDRDENVFSAKQSTSPSSSSTENEEEFAEQITPKIQRKTKTDKVFTQHSSDSEPLLKRLHLDPDHQEFINTKTKINFETQEIFIKSEEMELETESFKNKSNNEIISIEDDLPTTSSTAYQKDREISEQIAQNLDLYSKNRKSLGIVPRIVKQISLVDVLQQDNAGLGNFKESFKFVTNEANIDVDNDDPNPLSSSSSKEEEENDLYYKCALCDLKFSLERQFSNHLEEIHNETISEMRYECKECYKKFRNLSGLKYHFEYLHKIDICQVNLKKHYFITQVLLHEQRHHLTTPAKCQHCQTQYEIGTQYSGFICKKCGSSPKKYQTSCDSIPKAQIKTKKPLP